MNIDPTLESFQFTQNHIEQWMIDHALPTVTEVLPLPQEEIICYGTVSLLLKKKAGRATEASKSFFRDREHSSHPSQIFRASLKLLGNMLDLDTKLNAVAGSSITGHTKMNLIRSDTQYHVTFPDGTVLGEMNVQLEEALNSILEQQHSLEFEVFAPTRAIRETISKATKEKDAVARVQINVYGTLAASKAIGRELSQRKIYLQRPECVRSGSSYNNPHVLKLGDYKAIEVIQTSDVVEPTVEKVTGHVVKETITNVYSTLTRGQHLKALEGDPRLLTPLLW